MDRSTTNGIGAVLVTMLSFIGAPMAQAGNTFDNGFLLIEGESNTLEILSDDQNSLSLTVLGDNNGGFDQVWPSDPMFDAFPAPGIVKQTGLGNVMNLAVFGTNNLFSMVQTGQNNAISGFI